jgi:hypothetical protein
LVAGAAGDEVDEELTKYRLREKDELLTEK